MAKWHPEPPEQGTAPGASEKLPTMDVGDKIKGLIVKLQEMHEKEKFLVFTEGGKIIQLEIFPKEPVEIKRAAQEKVSSNAKYFKMFNMIAEIAKYDVQLRLNRPNMV
eukprot:8111471-Ditylum_brightwellii.AAC.1